MQKMTNWNLLYYLLRANFDAVRSEYVYRIREVMAEGEKNVWGKARYSYGKKVTSVKEAGDRVEVQFENTVNGEDRRIDNLSADLLIAADGPSSTVQRLLLPDAP